MFAMDLFDRRILTVLKDGKPKEFQRLLRMVEFSHNTLRRHLTRLQHQGLIVRAKKPRKDSGRPKFTYSLPPKLKHRVALTLTKPYTTIVSLTFQKLRHLCRFEKGGYCKKIRGKCTPQNCPQIVKGE